MPRPRGLPRWAFLLLACTAIAAVAMIPRGIVRTTEASQLPDAVLLDGDEPRIEGDSTLGAELPGIRAVVSRDERDLVVEQSTLGDAVAGAVGVQVAAGVTNSVGDEPPGGWPEPSARSETSRAPPSSI